jgi:tRNA pseudouridine32 synthase/23S rRNA pseudouridine746 synthase
MDVLYNDHDLLVVNKPSGLLSVPGKGPDKQDCLWTRLQTQHPGALVVHRLDQATSGLMVFALNPATQRALSMAFEARQVDKQYLAWVEGVLPVSEDWQTIDLPILLDWPNRPVHIIDACGKPSVTLWRCVQQHATLPGSLLELQPQTGRTHQLRVHLKAIGHPIWGDALYAPPEVLARAPRLLLHAQSLALQHPLTHQALRWTCAPDW